MPAKRTVCLALTLLLGTSTLGDEIVNLVLEQETARNRIIEKLDQIHTVLIEGYDFVARTSVTVTIPFKSFKHIAVLHYEMPLDVSIARFSFQVEDVLQSQVGSCDPEDVIVHLKHGSYPAVNPDGYPFPRGFIDEKRRDNINTLQLKSSGDNQTLAVVNPRSGGWFAMAYLRWEESAKIEQQDTCYNSRTLKTANHIENLHCHSDFFILRNKTPSNFICQTCLAVNCDAILYTDLQVKRGEISVIDCYSEIEMLINSAPTMYKCMIKDNVTEVTLKIKIHGDLNDITKATIKLQGMQIPSDELNVARCYMDLPMSDFQSIKFYPLPNAWHYLVVEKAPTNYENIPKCNQYDNIKEENVELSIIDLTKDNKGVLFSFDFNIPSTGIEDTFSVLNVTSNKLFILRFHIHPSLDIGGTMLLTANLLMTLKYQMGFKRRPPGREKSLMEFSEDDQFFKVVMCQGLGYNSIPMQNGTCKFNSMIKPALFVLNSTDSDTIGDNVLIPFPEAGIWYLTVRMFCDEVVCPCRVSPDNTKKYFVEVDPLKTETYRNTSGAIANSRAGVSECATMMRFTIKSMPCVFGKCSDRGSCLFVISGASVMSTCYCTAGYGGWDCSDDSRIKSPLLSVLLLTLSNLIFFVSIYVATVRKYYAEAVMYTFAMILSTFYHACDAPMKTAFCIVNKSLLQFGDFYCGIMAFWVTLLAMSILKNDVLSMLQIAGAIVIACLVSWNKTNVLSFTVPMAGGLLIVICTWVGDYKRTKKMRYSRNYYMISLPVGIILVGIGLVCFAFLQTENNYMYVHSVWHALIAIAVAFLLPYDRRGRNTNRFMRGFHHFSLRKILRIN